MKGLRDQGFGRIIHVNGEVAKNVDYSGGKASSEQGKTVDGKVEGNGCQKPWALEKKLIEGSNREQGGFVS